MKRTVRELGNTAEGMRRGLRLVRRCSWLCGLVAAASGCLVTENTDFGRSAAKPQPIALRPSANAAVPFTSDLDCANLVPNERAMRFESTVFYPDIHENDLFARLIVNGRTVTNLQLRVETNGSTMRAPALEQQCVPYSALALPCNLVELITSTDLDKVSPEGRPAAGALDLDFGVTSWFVLGTSEDQPGASRDDCAALFRDGGV